MNVYVITGVAVPGGMLLDARLKATRMFREIGVNLRLRMGRPAHDSNDTCSARILIQLEPTTRYPVPPDGLAYALPYKDGGTCIHIFLDRVSLNRILHRRGGRGDFEEAELHNAERAAASPRRREGPFDEDSDTQTIANALLAQVMVHEIVHVLEQMQHHSASSVMKARWSAAD